MKHIFSAISLNRRAMGLLALVWSMVLCAGTARAQTVIFDVGPNSLPPPAGWTVTDDPTSNDVVDWGAYYMLEPVYADEITTASYNLTGYTNVELTLEVLREVGTNPVNPVQIDISTDGGGTFSSLPQSFSVLPLTPYSTWTIGGPFTLTTLSAQVVLRFTNPGSNGRGVRLRKLRLTGTPPTTASIATSTVAGAPFCVSTLSGASVSVPFTISGTFAAGNNFQAQLSAANGTFPGVPTVIGTLAGTAAGTLAATIPAGTLPGSQYRIRVVGTNPAATGTDNGMDLVVLNAASNTVTSLVASPANAEATLQWDNPPGCYDNVLIIGRAVSAVTAVPSAPSYLASSVFGAGAAVSPGQFVVYQGTGTSVTVTGLINGTTYHFSVFTKLGSVYSTGSTVVVNPVSGPALTEIYVPRYIVGHSAGATSHGNRLPYAFRVRLTGLLASKTYRYYNQAVISTDGPMDDGAGNPIFARQAGNFIRTTGANLGTTNDYGTFTTDATGRYTGWFVLDPTGNARFDQNQQVQMRIYLNNGNNGTAVVTRLTTVSSARSIQLSGTSADGTGVYSSSMATARNFIVAYDNVSASGRPLAATFVESDGTASGNSNNYAGFYANNVEAAAGSWGLVMPNNSANGIRRIEQRALSTGNLVGCAALDDDGVWPSGASTVSPRGGSTAIELTTLDAPLDCNVYVGLNPQDVGVPEGNTGTRNVSLLVTVTRPPATPLSVLVFNAGGGTASLGVDYLFSNQTLNFPTTGSYPLTQTVLVQFVGDLAVESNETINLGVSVLTGSATVLPTVGNATISINDDDYVPDGLIINEFSQGPSGAKEYLELLVTGAPGTTLDIRGWTVDDNNGDFSAGPQPGVGISAGHFRFADHCTWEKIPVGSLIILYNANDRNALLPVDDPTDANLDYVYVVPVVTSGSCLITGNSGDYLAGYCSTPNTGDGTYPAVNAGPSWGTLNVGTSDAVQVRRPVPMGSPTFAQGLSFATSASSDISALNHPDYLAIGSDALFFDDAYQTYFFSNTTGNDPRRKSNWLAQLGNGYETPGSANNTNNGLFIESLRRPLVPSVNNSTYTCGLRPNERRVFLDASNNIILRVSNASSTNHGNTQAEIVLAGNSQNTFLPGKPFLASKQWRLTPTVTTGANYSVTFYMTDAEINSYVSYVNANLSSERTRNQILASLRLYKRSSPGNPLVNTALNDLDITVGSPQVGSYGVGTTTFTATFTSFSSFALGVTEEDLLPVELTRFGATALGDGSVRLNWATASEKNNDYYEVLRATDGLNYAVIGKVEGHGTTLTPREYSFLDRSPARPLSYYRLRQIDFDGTAHLSTVVTAQTGKTQVATLQTWPQPFEDDLKLRLTSPLAGVATVRLYDLQGRLVLEQTLTVPAGTQDTTLPAVALPHGAYVLTATLPDGQVLRTRVVK